MKNDSLIMSPMPLIEPPPKTKSIKIETPIGTVESDSGNHLIDIGTVIIIIGIFFIFRNYFRRA